MPKTWGNTRGAHRIALLVGSLGCGCTTTPGREETHPIRAHWLEGCPPPSGGAPAEFDIEALGDFPPSAETHEVLLSAGTERLVVPASTLGATVEATAGATRFHGVGLTDPERSMDVSLWPVAEACVLYAGDGVRYPGTGQGVGLAAFGDSSALLAVGGEPDSRIATGALTIDLGTGRATSVSAEDGPRAWRAGGTVTPFGRDLLVAGGYDPVHGREVLASAEVFDAATRRFLPDKIPLAGARERHAAVVLASGETLLVGGAGADGSPLRTLEAVLPATRRYRIGGLAELRTARLDPVALRLSDGRVLVAGGTAADGAPVGTLEWLTPDGSAVDLDQPAPASPGAAPRGRAFAAMPGGGVLTVGCTVSQSGATPPCRDPCAAGAGCPDSYWITKEGRADRLPDPRGLDVTDPVLVPGSDGRPWLVAAAAGAAPGAGSRVLRRFDPWLAEFAREPSLPAPLDGPPLLAGGAPTPPRFVAVDAGLFVWLLRDPQDGHPVLAGFRHGTRTPFAQRVAPLLLGDTEGIALDRTPILSDGPGKDAWRDAATGTVVLTPDAAATLVITDVTYADVRLGLDVRAGAPPVVHLGSSAYGSGACGWPSAPTTGPLTATLARVGGDVRLTIAGASRSCRGPSGRVSIRLQASTTRVEIASITVNRGAP